jgi:hypothetical protein
MQILFVISILSLLVLLWSAVAITRRIRTSHKLESSSTQSQPEFSQYLFSATEGTNASPPQSVRHPEDHDPAVYSSWNMSPSTQVRTHFDDKATSPKRG